MRLLQDYLKKERVGKATMSNTNGEHSSGGGFLNGLLLGLLIGGGAVFLFGTKKGKRLLKLITEEGLEGISELENFIEDEADYQEEPFVRQKVSVPQKPVVSRKYQESTSTPVVAREELGFEEDRPEGNTFNKARRLFKGIRKR